jgi:hypothetical protein
MDPYREIRQELVERSVRLARRVSGIERDLGRYGGATERGDPLGEIVDAASHELHLIEDALKRLDSGAYGHCGRCSGKIGLQRLRLLPYAVNCEVCAPGLDMDALKELRVQHLGLRELLRAIEQRLKEQRLGGDGSTSGALLVLLADLARELPEHFAFEERGGYLADAIAVAPRLTAKAAELYRDHAELARRSRDLLEQARSAAEARAGWAEVEAGFAALATLLSDHEEAENALVREAFTENAATGA